jgi:hypothetical protein
MNIPYEDILTAQVLLDYHTDPQYLHAMYNHVVNQSGFSPLHPDAHPFGRMFSCAFTGITNPQRFYIFQTCIDMLCGETLDDGTPVPIMTVNRVVDAILRFSDTLDPC